MGEMSKTWTIDAEGVLTIWQGFRKRKGTPDFYARREEIRAIVVEEGVSEIGDGWFSYLNEVREITLPTTLRRIGKSAFASCQRLKEVSIPEGVEELAESAFQDCSHVRRFHLPASLRNIGYLALHVGDGQLLSIDVANGNEHFTSNYGVLYNHDKTTILQYPCGKRRKEYTILASVTTVAGDCFSHARHLEHASLPEGLKAMGSSAFGFCRKLKSMWVPDGVSIIPSYAFFCCESLTSLHLPERLEALGAEAFTFCPLTEFRISQGIQMLDYAVLAYTLIREIVIPESVTEINNSAFYKCEHLQKVVLPKTLQSIWEKAFCYCRSLTEIEIPAEVWNITDDVFEGCTNLRRIILHSKAIDSLCWVPEGVELIQETGDDRRH